MSIGVSTEFIDLTDGEWHVLPSNAINIIFECEGAGATVTVKTAHTANSKIHELGTMHTQGSGAKDHLELESATHKFVLQNVKVDGLTVDENGVPLNFAKVYFGRSK